MLAEVIERENLPPLIRFEKRPIEDKKASTDGQIVYKDVDFVLVTPPYSRDIVVHKVETWFSQVDKNVRSGKVPAKHRDFFHESYKKWKAGEALPLNGTSIKTMTHLLTPAQIKTCLAAEIYTVESLAAANDQGLKRLGLGGVEMKNKATAHLKAAQGTGKIVMENAALKKQVEVLEASVSALQDKLNKLSVKLDEPENEESITADDLKIEWEVTELVDDNPIQEAKVSADVADLRELYKAKFGTYPKGRMKEETMRARINGDN